MPSVLWHCWLGGRKGIRSVKNWVVGCWRGCLERGADLHMAQLMPLPLAVSCFSKSHISFTFLVPAHPGSPGKRAVKRVYVCLVHNMHIFHNPQTSQTMKYFNSKSWIISVLSISHRGMAALNLYSSYILRKWYTNCRKYNSTAHDNQNVVVIAKKRWNIWHVIASAVGEKAGHCNGIKHKPWNGLDKIQWNQALVLGWLEWVAAANLTEKSQCHQWRQL